nr:MAG TPA: hypothetical protein [Caudoviricetes sp.]
MLRQLELNRLQIAIAIGQLVAERLHGVTIDQGTSSFAIGLNSIDHLTGVLIVLRTDSIDVAVGLAAAILLGITTLSDLATQGTSAVQHSIVHGVEAITQAVGQTTYTILQIVEVEVLAQIGTSQSPIVVTTEDVAAETEHEQEQHDNPEPTALTVKTIVVSSSGADIRERITGTFHHGEYFLSFYIINVYVAHHKRLTLT